jgi:hypothetical protein
VTLYIRFCQKVCDTNTEEMPLRKRQDNVKANLVSVRKMKLDAICGHPNGLW